MAHGNTVTDGNGREDNGRTAGHGNAEADGFRNLIQVHVARDNFVVRADNADERTFQFLFGQSQCVVQGPMRGVVETIYDGVFDHVVLLP